MTLANSIDDQLSSLSLTPIHDSQHHHHLYADYCELITLFSNGDYVTPTHFVSRLSNDGIQVIDDIENDTGDEIGALNDQLDDRKEAWGLEVFLILSERATIFGDNYPFEVDDTKIVLKNTIQPIQKIYLMLLLSSSLKHFPILSPRLTTEFEQVSFVALKNYLPNHAEVKHFGKNTDYSGSAIKKIRSLAAEMGLDVVERELESVSPRNNQEEGLDLVGWIPFSDKIPSMVSLFGQCACGKKWHSKQNETRRYEVFLNFYRIKPIHALFVPYAIGQLNGLFHQSKEINEGSLVFDRKRITDLIEDADFFNDLESKEIVQKFIDFEEDTV